MIAPPRFATWLLEAALPSGDADAVSGDLWEEFTQYVAPARGVRAACWWYRSQVARSLAPIVLRSWQRASVTRAWTAVTSAAVAATLPATGLMLLRTFTLQQVPLKTTPEPSLLFAVALAGIVIVSSALGVATAVRVLNRSQHS